MSTKKVNSKYS